MAGDDNSHQGGDPDLIANDFGKNTEIKQPRGPLSQNRKKEACRPFGEREPGKKIT